jgi:hypothetical protein
MKMKRPFSSNLQAQLEAAAKPQNPTLTARTRLRPGKGKVSCTFNLSPEMYRRLQDIKIARGTSLQALLEEAVDVWLASLGETSFRGKE